jgi:hypothetical protein
MLNVTEIHERIRDAAMQIPLQTAHFTNEDVEIDVRYNPADRRYEINSRDEDGWHRPRNEGFARHAAVVVARLLGV